MGAHPTRPRPAPQTWDLTQPIVQKNEYSVPNLVLTGNPMWGGGWGGMGGFGTGIVRGREFCMRNIPNPSQKQGGSSAPAKSYVQWHMVQRSQDCDPQKIHSTR